jgi:hypothetical protein
MDETSCCEDDENADEADGRVGDMLVDIFDMDADGECPF